MKLGVNQLGVLRSLVEHRLWFGGGWGCGWIWASASNTERILDTLVKRGMAVKAIEPILTHKRTAMVWRPSEAGLALVDAERLATGRAK